MMSKIFTRTFRVRFAEVDPSGYINPAHYLRYLVETAYDWGARYGFGQMDNKRMGLIWVIRETYFEFLQPLRHDDTFEFSIWMVAWRRVRGSRSFELRRKDDGEVLAQGGQQIVSLDAETLRPTAPPEGTIDPFWIENPRVVSIPPFPKNIMVPPNADSVSLNVRWRDLDMDDQLNNAVYADYAREALVASLAKVGWPPHRLRREGLALVDKTFHIRYLAMGTWGAPLEITAFMRQLDDCGGGAVRRPRAHGGRRSYDGNALNVAVGESGNGRAGDPPGFAAGVSGQTAYLKSGTTGFFASKIREFSIDK